MAMGERGLDWLAALQGYECAVVTESGDALRSGGLPVVPADPPGPTAG